MGISNISGKSLASIKIPLPPTYEQDQIVEKLENLMTFCDDLELSIKESQVHNEQLLQQVLRETLQPKKQVAMDSLFENKNYDLYVAMMQKLVENQLHINYGEVATQKTVFHLNTFTDEKIPYLFMNSNYGTYSFQLKDDLTKNPYLTKSKIGNGEVFVVKPNKEKEIKDALAKPENKSFVDAVKKVLTIYENPVINKETEKVELLNTVSKMMIDFQTSDLETVYEGMRNWEIKQKGFKNKAEKFSKNQTKGMISLIEKLGLVKNLIA